MDHAGFPPPFDGYRILAFDLELGQDKKLRELGAILGERIVYSGPS